MDELWDKAIQIHDKKKHYRLWLIWTIGQYANEYPWVELRCIYTDEGVANRVAQTIRKYELPDQRIQRHKGRMWFDRVHVEKRVSNHPYGAGMMEMRAHLKEL